MSSSSNSIALPKEPKVSTPDKFNGNRKKFRTFMSQVNAVFELNASRFHYDKSKILYIGTLLTDDAAVWFESTTRNPDQLTYDGFLKSFKLLFEDPYSTEVARREIRRLKQGTMSASTYAMKFLALAFDTGYDNAALMDQFRINLSSDLKNVLATALNTPDKLEEYVNFVIGIDNRLFERRLEMRFEQPRSPRTPYLVQHTPTQAVTPTPTSQTVPVDVDAVHVSANIARPRGPLSQEEKDRRRRDGLCMYCGAPGHHANICPAKSKNAGVRRH
jgi:hypothetical protein